ncbi:putative phage tail protein [Aneurinibacillus terranovensis]|uniref:putative phage tail protein n=1 Tax=Aneurinibacillus terranovensis TaxID=278991 RepID=UPI0004043A66|nr:putative phage tail protein [Aneurinibacillus terranovensis]
MGFKDFLYNTFPHRWLDRKDAGNERLFGGLGNVLDYLYSFVEKVQKEANPATAEDLLPTLESMYGLTIDASLPLQDRQNRLIARMRERGGTIRKEVFEEGLSLLLGTPVTIVPDIPNYAVEYQYQETGAAINLALAEDYVVRNKRAHIRHTYSSHTIAEAITLQQNAYSQVVDFPVCGLFYTEGES